MRNLLYIATIIAVFSSCGRAVSSDVSPDEQAKILAEEYSPEKAARKIIDWLEDGDTADREFSRTLSANILMYYDTIGATDSARRFITAFDSISARLSPRKQAHLLLMMNTPGKVASMIARQLDNAPLIIELEEILKDNDAAASEFTNSLEAARKRIKRLENENSGSVHPDN
ncbi:MAG: hypothetical protein K2M11_02720 [Paramuribaculum sp.]|nr:hypothetical protein [Paramuribaculum sp.]